MNPGAFKRGIGNRVVWGPVTGFEARKHEVRLDGGSVFEIHKLPCECRFRFQKKTKILSADFEAGQSLVLTFEG